MRFPLLTALLLTLATPALAKPLPLRAWEFQDYNMPHIRRMIDLAADRHINRIHLSHEILMYATAPVSDPQLAKDINEICDRAHARGIRVDVWCRELSDIPERFVRNGKIDLNDPDTWEAIRHKYVDLLEVCPGIDGIVLTMSEGSVGIWYDTKVTSDLPAEERMAKLIDTIGEVCEEQHKELYVRSFAYTPGDIRVIQEGIKRAKCDVIAMPKCVPHDWQPFYPFSPEIGDTNGKRQVIEFDLGHEFTGLSRIPYINIDYVKRHLDYDISKGADGAVFRVERGKWWAVDTPNQAVIDVASTLLVDPDADPHKLYRWWLEDLYPARAVPHLYSAFMRTPEIVEKGLFVLGSWVSDHSRLPAYSYAKSHLKENSVARWDASDHWKAVERELLNPTPATIRKIDEEKNEALRLTDASIADVEKAKPYLDRSDYAQMLDLFRRERAMVEVWKAAMDVIFGIDIYAATHSPSDRAYLSGAADTLESVTSRNQQYLIDMLADYSDERPTTNVDRAVGLVKQARGTAGG